VIRCKLITAVLVFALAPSALFAQTAEPSVFESYFAPDPDAGTTKRFSPNLAIAGGVTAGVGLVLLLSTIDMPDTSDGTTFNLTGDRYCVTNRPSEVKVSNGGCSSGAAAFEPEFRAYAYGTIAAGVAMTWIGLHKVKIKEKTVTVNPAVSTTSAALHGSVSWGGVK
jgi:hypothetical protein